MRDKHKNGQGKRRQGGQEDSWELSDLSGIKQ